jgi:DNA-binding transcriptional ArsR family regulator
MASDLLTTVTNELDARLRELRPLVSEYEGLVAVADSLGIGDDEPATRRAGAANTSDGRGSKHAVRNAAAQAILAALEHGSHTASELATVTGMSSPNVQSSLRRLLRAGVITMIKREGKTAYVLSSPSTRV